MSSVTLKNLEQLFAVIHFEDGHVISDIYPARSMIEPRTLTVRADHLGLDAEAKPAEIKAAATAYAQKAKKRAEVVVKIEIKRCDAQE